MAHGRPARDAAELDRVERAVLARISPTAEAIERVRAVAAELTEKATDQARSQGLPLVRALVAGSAARGTFLNDRLDIDLFLLFPPDFPRAALESAGLSLGRALLERPIQKYAEHPYLRGEYAGFTVEAVPGYAVTDPSRPLSAVDRTPFHQAYLASHETPGLVDQVRLTKQFLRGLGIYGSDARTGGFSGYLVELLVVRFGSFRSLLQAARGWRIPVRLVSTEGAAPRVPEDVGLVLDDPVDPNRNVATALSRRNLALFILAAGRYLTDPSPAAFELPGEEELSLSDGRSAIAERGTHVTVLTLAKPDLVDDILYPQLRKAERSIRDEAVRLDFHALGTASAAGADRAVVLLEVMHGRLPSVELRDGPPAGLDRVGDFIQKWTRPGAEVLQGPYVGPDGKLAVEIRRSERTLEALLTAALPRLPLGKDLTPGPVEFRPLGEAHETPELRRALAALLRKGLPFAANPRST